MDDYLIIHTQSVFYAQWRLDLKKKKICSFSNSVQSSTLTHKIELELKKKGIVPFSVSKSFGTLQTVIF